jgi:hypothetical protein
MAGNEAGSKERRAGSIDSDSVLLAPSSLLHTFARTGRSRRQAEQLYIALDDVQTQLVNFSNILPVVLL